MAAPIEPGILFAVQTRLGIGAPPNGSITLIKLGGDITAAGKALLDDATATAQRTTLGLGNVDNTSDVSKPVSTATSSALSLKAALASPAFTGTPTAPTATSGTNTTQLATTAFVQSAIASTALSWSAQASSFFAAVGNGYVITGNSVTATLPASALRGDRIQFVLRSGITNFIVGRNTRSIHGVAEDMDVDVAPYVLTIVWDDTTNGWWLA